MARRTRTTLTEMHMKILAFAYDYYEKNRVGPLFNNIEKYTGATKKDIEQIFPYGLNSIYTWVGIPVVSTNEICKPVANVKVDKIRNVYFDHSATTYIREEVQDVLVKYYSGKYGFGNPSSSNFLGKKAFEHIMKARSEIASCLHVKPSEITFTGCGSEANNLAIKGIALKYYDTKGHIITSQTEHPSVLETVQFLGMLGFEVTFLDSEKNGQISAEAVKNALRSDTILVAIMAVNHEIGTINPIEEIGTICKLAEIPFMVDGVQAFGKIEICPEKTGISLMTMSGHKIYGPKGVGALYINEKLSIVPLLHGGMQEYNRRAGTENVGHIMAFAQAAKLAYAEMKSEMQRITKLRNYFLEKLKKIIPDYIINGSMKHRVPTNLNIGFPNVDSGALLISLNQIGVYVSSGSACNAGSKEISPVINAMGTDTSRIGTIRFGFGRCNTKDDVDYLFKYLPDIIKQIRHDV